MRDYKKALYFFSIILLSLVGLYSHNLEPKLKPEDNLPSYEIAFMMREGDLIGFIHPDGNGLVTRSVKIPVDILFDGDPFKVYSDFLSEQITWSADGKYLGIKVGTKYRSLGFPVLISSEGQFVKCPQKISPITNKRYWINGDQHILILTGTGLDSKISIYDMSTCREERTYLEANQIEEGAFIREAGISSQGWFAVVVGDYYGYGNIEPRIEIISSDQSQRFVIINEDGQGPIAWSKDGEWIAFISYEESEGILTELLFVAKKDGSELKEITEAHDSPSWSPDGKWIVFERDGNIYKVNVETKEEYKVTEGYSPSWRWDIP